MDCLASDAHMRTRRDLFSVIWCLDAQPISRTLTHTIRICRTHTDNVFTACRKFHFGFQHFGAEALATIENVQSQKKYVKKLIGVAIGLHTFAGISFSITNVDVIQHFRSVQ